MDRPVRGERTGWRDQKLSERHRDWGFNCPAVDLDFLMVEYNVGLPVAVVEYKHHMARMPDFNHPTYRALRDLADGYKGGGLPFMVAFYWPEVWAFRVIPANEVSRKWFEPCEALTERDFVTRLYRMRAMTIRREVLDRLNTWYPQDEAA